MKKWMTLIALVTLIGLMLPTTIYGQDIKLVINNQEVKTEVAPIKENGSTLVPIKVVATELGATVNFDSKKQLVTIVRDDKVIELPIGKKEATVNGKQYELTVPSTVINGITMIPARFVADNLGCSIGWDSVSNTVTITSNNINVPKETIVQDTKNIYTAEYLQKLVDNTPCSIDVLNFREQDNPRRKGLIKLEGKYFDIYYPSNNSYAQEVANTLKPHMDKAYMMLTDLYGIQAKVEVHLIDGEIGASNMSLEGEIRAKENVTFIWLEEWNDRGGNNISELVHEMNHNFFDQVNGKRNYKLWLNEANSKLIPSLYIMHNYSGVTDMWSFYEVIKVDNIAIKTVDEYLNGSKKNGDPWSAKQSGSIERKCQRYGLSLWSYVYNQCEDLDTFKYYLRNMSIGQDDSLETLELLLGQDISTIERNFLEYKVKS